MTKFLTEHDVSKLTGVAVQTLRNWRHKRRGPAYSKIGRLVRYDPDDVEAYIQRRRIDPEKLETA
jgi:predicted DNA-binding transcriptional regulator AlpA